MTPTARAFYAWACYRAEDRTHHGGHPEVWCPWCAGLAAIYAAIHARRATLDDQT